MDCNETRRLVPLSIDGELDAHSEDVLAAHIESCSACQGYRQRQEAALAAIRSMATYHRATASLRERIEAALPTAYRDAAVAHRHPAASGWKFAWQLLNGGGLVAAACAVLVLAVVLPLRPSADERLAGELVTSHARALLTNHVIDVVSSDQHTVKPWFNGKLDFSPPVSDLADRGFPLVGGRLDYLDHHTVAVVVYRHRQHLIDVFVWPSKDTATAPPRSAQGYHIIGKTASGMTFRAVSEVNRGDLQQLVDML